MEFRVLGPFDVLDTNGRQLELGPPRARALLAFLVLHANELVATERLVDELWPAGAPDTAAKVVHVYVSQLRKALGDARGLLATRPPGYVLSVGEEDLDLRRFEALLGRAETLAGTERRETLVTALGLWRGEPLAEFAYESFAQPEIARLLELRLLALEARVDVDLELGRSSELVPELEALVADQPLRERFREQLMLALYRAGRQADALAAYRAGQHLLAEELGLEPGEQLRELERAILRQDPALALAGAAPAAASAPVPRSILVVPAGAELGELLELAVPLAAAAEPARELLLARVVPAGELSEASNALSTLRTELASAGTTARVAAFSSEAPGDGLLVVGLSDRWRSEGLGAVREALVASPVAPTVFVRRGVRPGGLAPEHTLTRFTWSIAQPGASG